MLSLAARLDDLGKPAWIALTVLGFLLWWPLGLALLAYLLWSGRMMCGWHGGRGRWQERMAARWEERARRWRERTGWNAPTGNRAFDEYRRETLRRLEEESREFRAFLDRLRLAKDRAEFDQFMAERRNRPSGPAAPGAHEEPRPQGTPPGTGTPPA